MKQTTLNAHIKQRKKFAFVCIRIKSRVTHEGNRFQDEAEDIILYPGYWVVSVKLNDRQIIHTDTKLITKKSRCIVHMDRDKWIIKILEEIEEDNSQLELI